MHIRKSLLTTIFTLVMMMYYLPDLNAIKITFTNPECGLQGKPNMFTVNIKSAGEYGLYHGSFPDNGITLEPGEKPRDWTWGDDIFYTEKKLLLDIRFKQQGRQEWSKPLNFGYYAENIQQTFSHPLHEWNQWPHTYVGYNTPDKNYHIILNKCTTSGYIDEMEISFSYGYPDIRYKTQKNIN